MKNPLVDGLTEHLRTAKADLQSTRQQLAAAEQKAATERAARTAAEAELQRMRAGGEITAVLERLIKEALAPLEQRMSAATADTEAVTRDLLAQVARRLLALETKEQPPADPLVFDVQYDGNGDVRRVVARES